MTCAHGFIGACVECDGSGQRPSREWDEDLMCFRSVFWNCPSCHARYHEDEPICQDCQCECGALLPDEKRGYGGYCALCSDMMAEQPKCATGSALRAGEGA